MGVVCCFRPGSDVGASVRCEVIFVVRAVSKSHTLCRHGVRGAVVMKLVKLALVVGAIAVVAKLVAAKKAAWHGLTESEVRDKLESRLPKRVPEGKRAAVADKVVSKMRERGALRDEEEPSAPAPTDSGRGGEEPKPDDAEAGEDSDDNTESA